MEFGDILKQIRKQRGMTQDEFANLLHTSKQVISRYENKQRIPKVSVLAEYADSLGVSRSCLSGESSLQTAPSYSQESSPHLFKGLDSLPKMKPMPVIGTIACGTPILAEQNIEEYVNVPEGVNADFLLRCKGDSMIEARIFDGDLVFIREQPDVENGEIAAVMVDDDTATLKRVVKQSGQLILMPANSTYVPMFFTGSDMTRVRIIGKAISFLSDVR